MLFSEARLFPRLLGPIALDNLATQAHIMTDLAVLGHLGTDFLASASLATIWMSVTSTFLRAGLVQSVRVLGSQAYGAGQNSLVGVWVQIGIWVSIVAAIPTASSWLLTGVVLRGLGIEERLAAEAELFARISMAWLPLAVLYEVLVSWMQLVEKPLPGMIINFFCVGLNLGLNVVLVHGTRWARVDWDGLGFVGSPIATTLTRLIMLVSMLLVTRVTRWHAPTWAGGWSRQALSWGRVSTFLKQGVPLSLGNLVEDLQIQVIGVLAGRMGAVAVATNNALINIFMLLATLEAGVMTATSIRVGHHVGVGDKALCAVSARTGFAFALLFAAPISLALWLGRDWLGHVFSRDPRVWSQASEVVWILAAGFFVDALLYAAVGVMEGQARSMVVASALFCGAWLVTVPLAFLFSLRFHWQVRGLWLSFTAGYAVTTVITVIAYLSTRWEVVIEAAKQAREEQKAKEPLLIVNE